MAFYGCVRALRQVRRGPRDCAGEVRSTPGQITNTERTVALSAGVRPSEVSPAPSGNMS